MAVSPDPRTLLLPDPEYVPSIMGNKFIPLLSTLLGLAATATARGINRRPLYSGIHHYVIFASLTGLFGMYIQHRYDKYYMERDAVLRHYIELHPEDFPMPERKKVGELFTSWTPIR